MASIVTTMSAGTWTEERDIALMQPTGRSLGSAGLSRHLMGKAFRTAVLLTGGIRQAETALLEAIGSVDPEQVTDETFLLDCVRASLNPARQCEPTIAESEDASSVLAPELKRILLLAPHLRQALVLRVLLGLSDDDCARFHVRDAGQQACAAVREISHIRAAKRGPIA